MKLTLTGRVGSVLVDGDENDRYYGQYEVSIFYEAVRYRKTVKFNTYHRNDIPVQGDGIAIEFDTESKEIVIL